LLECGIECEIRGVVEKEIELDVLITRAFQQSGVQTKHVQTLQDCR